MKSPSKRYIVTLTRGGTTTLLQIVHEREPNSDGHVASIEVAALGARLTRVELVRLRNQIDQWLEAHDDELAAKDGEP